MSTKVLTAKEWHDLIEGGKVKDISNELPDGFLMFGQVMRAKIILDGKTYFASGWDNGDGPWVTLNEATVSL